MKKVMGWSKYLTRVPRAPVMACARAQPAGEHHDHPKSVGKDVIYFLTARINI